MSEIICSGHLNIEFISSSHHGISPMYYVTVLFGQGFRLTVEHSEQCIFKEEEYSRETNCKNDHN